MPGVTPTSSLLPCEPVRDFAVVDFLTGAARTFLREGVCLMSWNQRVTFGAFFPNTLMSKAAHELISKKIMASAKEGNSPAHQLLP